MPAVVILAGPNGKSNICCDASSTVNGIITESPDSKMCMMITFSNIFTIPFEFETILVVMEAFLAYITDRGLGTNNSMKGFSIKVSHHVAYNN